MSESVSFWTRLATLQVGFMTWRRGVLVGTDQAGNRYFRDRKRRPGKPERRWVLFNGEPEATKIPPEWYGWIHHTYDEPLALDSVYHKPWQKAHQPNLSGTRAAYRPPGHPLAGGQRDRATGDYQAWTPPR